MPKALFPLMALSLVLACKDPASIALHRQPPPALSLELSLPPDEPDGPAVHRAYAAAFRDAFGPGLLASPTASAPDRIQLIVAIGQRATHPESEVRRNANIDRALAVASGNPMNVLHTALGPKSGFEEQVERLGYRPCTPNGLVVLLRAGTHGFQKSIELNPTAILNRMRPLGSNERTENGILAEEARAVALETLDLLHKQFGWRPPAPSAP